MTRKVEVSALEFAWKKFRTAARKKSKRSRGREERLEFVHNFSNAENLQRLMREVQVLFIFSAMMSPVEEAAPGTWHKWLAL